jgi:succinoglycan biosynthesis protein ExoA
VVVSVLLAVLQASGVVSGWPSALASVVYLGPIAYVLLVLALALTAERGTRALERWFFVVVLPTMHLSWGVGFIVGVLRGARDSIDTSRA